MLCHKESQPHTLEHDDTKSQSNIYNKSDEAHGSIRPPATKVRKLDKPGDSVFRNGNIRARLDSRSGSDSGVEGDGVQNMDESEPANGSGSVLPANELNTWINYSHCNFLGSCHPLRTTLRLCFLTAQIWSWKGPTYIPPPPWHQHTKIIAFKFLWRNSCR